MAGEMKYWKDGEVTTYDNPCVLRVMVLSPEKSVIARNATNKLFAEFLDGDGNPIPGLTVTGTLTKPDASTEILAYPYIAGVYTAAVVAAWTGLLGTYTFTAQTTIGTVVFSATSHFNVDVTLSGLYNLLKKHDDKITGLLVDC